MRAASIRRMRLAAVGLWVAGALGGSGSTLTVVALVDGLPWWPHVIVSCLGIFMGAVFSRSARVAALTARAEQAQDMVALWTEGK